LRKQLLEVPRLGVLNAHLGLLPEIRGMSSPEWSLLQHIPVGVTIHFMDTGIDTGPILQRYEFPHAPQCESLSDLRNRLIAFGIEKAGR
jgi:methionyl-tRNA formyltransferase